MFMDPEKFTIQQNKEMQLWPPSNVVALGLIPYIRKLSKTRGKLMVLDYGMRKGENAYLLLDRCSDITIKGIQTHPNLDEVLRLNLAQNPMDRFQMGYKDDEIPDVVCLDCDLIDLDKKMIEFYNKIKVGSILCGNEHHETKVKEALGKFRKETKAGPLLVSNGSWFVYKR